MPSSIRCSQKNSVHSKDSVFDLKKFAPFKRKKKARLQHVVKYVQGMLV